MAKNIPKKFLDFDDNIDGQFTSEKNTMPDHLRLFQGSPPPTRGLLFILKPLFIFIRITPAHAGTTCECTHFLGSSRDHPRPRGDY